MKKILLISALLSTLTAQAGVNDPIASNAKIEESIPGQTSTPLSMSITTIKAARLLAVNTEVAERVEIFSSISRTRKSPTGIVSSLALPAHKTITFGTKQFSLKLSGLKRVLNAGEKIPLTVTYSMQDGKRKTLSLDAEVTKAELSYKQAR